MITINKEEQEDATDIIRGIIEDELLSVQDWSYNDDSFDHEFGTEKVFWIGYEGDDEITVEFMMEFDPEEDQELMDLIESPPEFYYDGEEFDAYFYLSIIQSIIMQDITVESKWRVVLVYEVRAEAE